MTASSGLGTVPQPAERSDAELKKVLDIAAYVGAVSEDEVNVSYTSLLIGMLWSDDPTSVWLQNESKERGVRVQAIYRSRRIDEKDRPEILSRVDSGQLPPQRTDPVSISARTVLSEAASIAQETGRSANDPMGVRHLAAVYFFRNPPGHNPQLHNEWGFEPEVWKKAFANFVVRQYPEEADTWKQVLAGYFPAQESDNRIPGTALANYVFDDDATNILRSVEERAGRQTPPVLTSEILLQTLLDARGIPDCASFAEMVRSRNDISGEFFFQNSPAFQQSGSAHYVSLGLKNILDRSRGLTLSTTKSPKIGVRHIIASILVAADSSANSKLVATGVNIPLLRGKLYRDFTRHWLADDGAQWHFHLVGVTPPAVLDYNPDAAGRGSDKLDVTRYATAFAAVMAAEGISPPLAIGIFGDWGSGKSFFMRLIQQETDRVTGFTETGAGGKRLFCSRVVPIEFNAWHYVEQNLWASLVQTIFQGLRKALTGDNARSDLMDEVLSKLELAKAARKDAEDQLQKAQAELVKRTEELDRAKEDARAKAAALNQIETPDVLAILRKTVLPDHRIDSILDMAETYIGVQGLRNLSREQKSNAAEVTKLIEQVRVTASRVGSSWDWLVRAPVSWSEIGAVASISAAIALGGGLIAHHFRDQIQTAWTVLSAASIEAGVVVSLVKQWAQRHLSKITCGLDEVDKVRAEIDAKVQAQRDSIERQIRQADTARADAEIRVRQAETSLTSVQQQVEQAQKELNESGSEQWIARLIERRLNDREYQKYLGIVSAIRSDFQTISDIMTSRKEQRAGESQVIDRIVLYIDDLDRCPAKQVVAVLEAIHLLLAFKVFVVVVGVDIRWAAGSLAEKYPRHLKTAGFEQNPEAQLTDFDDGATALDYLEKIFQIPFWLPPMQEEASRNMIAELVPATVETVSEKQSSSQTDLASGNRETNARPIQEEKIVVDGSAKGELARRVESISIEPEERRFMLGMAAGVGKSPRRLKRFVNTYRILKASIDALDRERFVLEGGKHGEYRAAMSLLAITSGAPRISTRVFEHLRQQNDTDTCQQLVEFVQTIQDAEEMPYAVAAIQAYQNACGGTDAILRDLKYWAPHAARFSFRSGRG